MKDHFTKMRFWHMLSWSALRPLGNSPLARATALMPIVGYIILLNENARQFFALDPYFFGPLGSQRWRLIALYWGFFFTGSGALIFQIFCPPIIKRYGLAEDYTANLLSYHRVVAHAHNLDRILAGILASATPSHRIRAGIGDADFERLIENSDFSDSPGVEQDSSIIWCLGLHWNLLDKSKIFWCGLSTIFYALGLIILGVPALETLYRVAFVTFG